MICFVDLDGVLVDFNKGVLRAFDCEDLEWPAGVRDVHKVLGISKNQFWSRLNEDFWANLPMMDDAREILSLVEAKFGRMNVCILSSPSMDPRCLSGKAKWLQKNLRSYLKSYLLGPSKYYCAHENSLLIDDAEKNVESYWANGGKAILMPRRWNRLHSISSPVDELARRLKEEDWNPEVVDDSNGQINFDFN